MYDEDYFTKAKNSPYIGYPKSVNGENLVEEQMKYRTKDLIKKYGANFSLLDLGCATGVLVKMLRDEGVSACGIDFADWAIDNRVTEYVQKGDVLKIKEMSHVDVIHSSDFLEHLPEDRIWEVLIMLSKSCDYMEHFIPFYKDYERPVVGSKGIHMCEVNGAWWQKVFSSIPNFEITSFPKEDHGGYITCKRVK